MKKAKEEFLLVGLVLVLIWTFWFGVQVGKTIPNGKPIYVNQEEQIIYAYSIYETYESQKKFILLIGQVSEYIKIGDGVRPMLVKKQPIKIYKVEAERIMMPADNHLLPGVIKIKKQK